MKIKTRIGALLTATSLLAAGIVTAGSTEANAASFTFRYLHSVDKYYFIAAYNNGIYAGAAEWNGDPGSPAGAESFPGDALRAVDVLSDGWGMEAHLNTGRIATTAGHTAPYTSPWKTGDLPENQHYNMSLYVVKDGSFYLSDYYTVTS